MKGLTRALILGVLAAAAGIATRPLLPIDETRYASVAWEMFTHGSWLVPHLNGAPYSVDRAAELHEHTVAGHFENTAVVLGDQWLQHLLAPGLERSQGTGFVLPHKLAVADDISGQDRG